MGLSGFLTAFCFMSESSVVAPGVCRSIGPCNSGSAKVLSHGGERGPQMGDIVTACALSALSCLFTSLAEVQQEHLRK